MSRGGDPGDTELHGVYPPRPPHPQCATHSTASPGDVPSLGAEGHIPITQFRAHSYPPAPKGRFPTPRTPRAPPQDTPCPPHRSEQRPQLLRAQRLVADSC